MPFLVFFSPIETALTYLLSYLKKVANLLSCAVRLKQQLLVNHFVERLVVVHTSEMFLVFQVFRIAFLVVLLAYVAPVGFWTLLSGNFFIAELPFSVSYLYDCSVVFVSDFGTFHAERTRSAKRRSHRQLVSYRLIVWNPR